MKTSIIILTHNKLDYTKFCIDSIRKYTNKDKYEIIVVDNNSIDGTIEWLKNQKDIRTIYNKENLGFSKGCNQGIKISRGDSILLLNNDVVVTSNWLDNLSKCLYSSKDIGAVGPVTNSCSYLQAINVNYKNTEEMIEFARKFNISNEDKWEERLKLIGFCMLVKREVIEKIGLLDERFTPANFEDDDYSFRIRKAGYRLILCKDTFIHHFGSTSFKEKIDEFNELLKINRGKFEEKWGFDAWDSTGINNNIINLIDKPKFENINVLEIGCACGGTLLQIKNIYKNANLYGVELNKNAADIAKTFADVRIGNIESIKLSNKEEFFDYIIFGDVLEHLYEPWKVLKNMKRYLKDDGEILLSIPNVMNYNIIWSLINGNWTYEDSGILDKPHIRFFTLNEINKMFNKTDYKIEEVIGISSGNNENTEKFISLLNNITGKDLSEEYSVYQYAIKARKNEINIDKNSNEKINEKENNSQSNISDETVSKKSILNSTNNKQNRKIKFLLRRIENDILVEKSIEVLIDIINNHKLDMDNTKEIIDMNIIKKEKVLQRLLKEIEGEDNVK